MGKDNCPTLQLGTRKMKKVIVAMHSARHHTVLNTFLNMSFNTLSNRIKYVLLLLRFKCFASYHQSRAELDLEPRFLYSWSNIPSMHPAAPSGSKYFKEFASSSFFRQPRTWDSE